jgi:hypothetical protein
LPDAPLEPDVCPDCDRPLEPVADLTELVGFRAEAGGVERRAARVRARRHDDGAWGTLRA